MLSGDRPHRRRSSWRRGLSSRPVSGPPRVTILSPHHDDAVLSCWSLLTAPGDVRVINVFAGVPADVTLGWWDRETGASDSAERMRERRVEDAEALAAVGRAALDLDLLEDQYRTEPPDPGEVAGAV